MSSKMPRSHLAPAGWRQCRLRGDAGFFSFAAGKGLSLYEGGLWVARDKAMREALAQASAAVIPMA